MTRSIGTTLLAVLALAGCGDDEGGTGGSAASGSVSGTGGSGGAVSSSSGTSAGGGGAGGGIACTPPALPAMDDDTSVRGPVRVGAATVDVDGLRVEVLYPSAEVGADPPPKIYDVRDHLPASEREKIADEDTAVQTCDCADGLPIDESSGPYPVVVFVHGTAGFRTQSLELQTHWASRGFVVVAADHPGLVLEDLLALTCGQAGRPRDLAADLTKLTAALQAPSGDLAFLAGRIDAGALAMVGHSAGGAAIEDQGDRARVLIPMAAGGVLAGEALESTLVLGALEDQVVPFSAQEEGFASSPAKKRLVGLSPAGHLAFSSLCSLRNEAGDDIVTIGTDADVCGLSLAGGLFDCSEDYIDDERAWTIVNEASSAALEETLHCRPERGAWLAGIAERHPEVATFDEAL